MQTTCEGILKESFLQQSEMYLTQFTYVQNIGKTSSLFTTKVFFLLGTHISALYLLFQRNNFPFFIFKFPHSFTHCSASFYSFPENNQPFFFSLHEGLVEGCCFLGKISFPPLCLCLPPLQPHSSFDFVQKTLSHISSHR